MNDWDSRYREHQNLSIQLLVSVLRLVEQEVVPELTGGGARGLGL